ncbi:hypothetical protein PHYSODRAFT_301981 [Phytophthora sojae]|uniref:Uncharacterized protein n=1 Tax=Phytophthora sojae (strain P6497) TaxID=1094619 RepID=G4ZPE0_PHYSP|nr:hypothetical protein PHYSODRAFT_301981 [Phytophthora sojae]EGZ15474.1 hypothetical protein PHYSODRAFT_301981 [Phytophthora sojae]|eukprot:XP_009529223.1 hypothetical protein PHYSODRAFT_301981 [Phytophthora sojae]
MCKQALMNAVRGGHVDAVKVLLASWEEFELGKDWYFNHYGKHSPYDFDELEALEEAVKGEEKEIIGVICEKTEDPRELFNWAVEQDNLQVFQCVYQFHGEDEMENVFRAMIDAAGRGCLEIVKFVMEECGAELAELYECDLLFRCPLVTAIEEGKRNIVDYLYEHNGYKDASFISALCAAAWSGSLELVEMFFGKHGFDAAALDRAFASAARGGHLEIVRHLQSLQKFEQAAIDEAFVSAVSGAQMEALEYLCAIEGYTISAASLDEAFQNAAGSLQLDMLKHLDSKGGISRRAINSAFECAAIESGILSERRDVQVRVLEFLVNKGGVSPEAIDAGFSDATLRCRLDVVELLYSKGSISPKLVNKAFQEAAKHNCAEVVRFLYKTDLVSPKSVEKAFIQLRIRRRPDVAGQSLAQALFERAPSSGVTLFEAKGAHF